MDNNPTSLTTNHPSLGPLGWALRGIYFEKFPPKTLVSLIAIIGWLREWQQNGDPTERGKGKEDNNDNDDPYLQVK